VITRRAVLAAAVLWAAPLRAGQEGAVMTPASDLVWSYLADTVMGGVSQGGARMEAGVLRLSGTVSTANRGGFIQARTEMPEGLPQGTTGLRLRVRGNGERYFVHLRTRLTLLPWQYYQQGFETGPDWAEVTLPLADFVASGRMLAGRIRPEDIRSVGIVAYGRDHAADVSLAALGAV
jgi:hypothetical protein